MSDRVVVLIDMDCFYCQVESRLDPSLLGKPVAVIQYNQWKGGGIIAVNYEARDKGVTRHMRGDDAKKHCPEIILVSVPTVRDKADLTRYRDSGREVLSVLCKYSNCVQRASVDEAYIDLTKVVEERMKYFFEFCADKWKSTFVVSYSETSCNDEEERQKGFKAWLDDTESIGNTASLKLAIGALIVEEIREAVFVETGFKCSAGIAHNKILAKLACGLHKPNRQTILPLECVSEFYKTLPIRKIKNLGGKFGHDISENLGCQNMSDLLKFSEKELQNRYDEKSGSWLYNIVRGIDHEPVTARLLSKSIGCCKNFPGRTALITAKDVLQWLNKLAEELSERLLEDEAMNKRRANLLTVSMHLEINKRDIASTKSVALTSYEIDKISNIADQALRRVCKVDIISNVWSPPIKFLGLSAGKFSDCSNKISKFFKVSQNCDIKSLENVTLLSKNQELHKEENKLSFFERILQPNVLNSSKKLNIVPDFSKRDLYVDSDDSQSSLVKNFNGIRESPNDIQKEFVKKNLFSSEPEEIHIKNTEPEIYPQKQLPEPSRPSILNSKFSAKKNSLMNFLNHKNSANNDWVKPEELFPDLSHIDQELLKSLPLNFRNKVIKMQKENLKAKNNTISSNNETSNELVLRDVASSEIGTSVIKCEECGETVIDDELHQDMHYAMKLDKELNSGTQVLPTIRKQPIKTTNVKRKVINGKEKKIVKKMKSIDSFFKK